MSGAAIAVAAPSRRGWRQRLTGATPYLLLAPGLLWLVVFFIWPTIQMFLMSLSSGSLDDGFKLTWSIDAYQTAFGKFPKQMGNSLLYGGLATIFDFLIGFPVAYTVAFRGGRYKNLLLFLVIAPFFTSFLIRTISWKTLLGDEGPVLGFLKHALGVVPADFTVIGTPIAVVAGLTYNFLPFMILPLYVALEKIDPRLIEAANDLYANRWAAFRRVTMPLLKPALMAESSIAFVAALGDFVTSIVLYTYDNRPISIEIMSSLRVNEIGVAAAFGVILMLVSAAVLGVGARR